MTSTPGPRGGTLRGRWCLVLRLGAVLMAMAWALAGWANLPRLDHPQASAAGFAIGGTVFVAYLFGSRSTAASAMATANARAEAHAAALAHSASASSSSAQVAVVISSELGASAAGARQFSGLEAAPWMVGATRDPELEQDFLAQSLADGDTVADAEGEYA